MKNNIIFDFDSTLVTIEGIDELARSKGVYPQVEQLTKLAMDGQTSLEDVFERRLELIKPTWSDIEELADLYLKTITPGSEQFIKQLKINNNIFVVTGGYYQAVLKTTDYLGIDRDKVFANQLFHTENGSYVDFNRSIPLWQQQGKALVVKEIQREYSGKTSIIGDGMSDAHAKTNGEAFIHFTGVVNRLAVARFADHTLSRLAMSDFELLLS
jgi:phosphoserine phosphatase